MLTGLIPQAGRARDLLGSAGCLVVRSAARWDALRAALAAAGWEQPAEHPLARVDFTKQRIVGVFKFGDSGNAFTCLGASGDDRRREVKFAMSYVIYKGKVQAAMAWKFCFAAVPLAETLNVSVGTYHPMNGGLYPTLEKAREEWSAAFDAARGDLIDGVSALVTPKAAKIAAGEDIQAEFKLVLHPHQAAPGDRFAADANEAWVWDGKYSNGYRNYGFLVETPDGKVLELRRPEQLEWAKNAPHPEPITGAKPYLLPDGQPGAISLKNLGLNTDVPGRYRITGLYAETAQDAKAWRGKEQDVRLWGGNLASNTFEVEVAAK
ncbi:MAG: hypothetical protein M5U26_05065 [Planctomycetota bacterium]|nr:hypothetical protein [Planctomycetota bacterium]